MNIIFYSFWFDPTENRTQVFRFSSRRFIHSITDWLNVDHWLRVDLVFFSHSNVVVVQLHGHSSIDLVG